MGYKNIKGKILKFLIPALAFTFTATTLCANKIDVLAHNAYAVTITIDESDNSFKYTPLVQYEEGKDHIGEEIGSYNRFTGSNVPEIPVTGGNNGKYDTTNTMENLYNNSKVYKFNTTGVNDDVNMIFSFPSVCYSSVIKDGAAQYITNDWDATAEDEKLANRFVTNVVNTFNTAINFCMAEDGGNYSTDVMKNFCAKLANRAKAKSGQVTLGSTTFTFSTPTESEYPKKMPSGCTRDDFVTIKSSTGNKITLSMKCKKGYLQSDKDFPMGYKQAMTGDTLADENNLVDGVDRDAVYLSWKHVAVQGNYLADVKGVTFSSVTNLVTPGAFELAVSWFVNNIITGIRSFLGLFTMTELMLNDGNRELQYYYGIMPNGWFSSATLLHVVCQILAWSLIGFSFLKMLFTKQLSTINVTQRISMMEGFKNLILTAFLLSTFVVIFNTLIRLNAALVYFFGAASPYSYQFGTTSQTVSVGAFATVLIGLAFLVMEIYFNIVYLLRAITIAVLFGIAPLAIYFYSLGGKYTQIFGNYVKELVANIFLQSFHAMLISFFTNITTLNRLTTLELFVVMYSFIPLTNFIRSNILGLGAGITDNAKGVTGMATGIVSGAISGSMMSKYMKDKNGGSSSGKAGDDRNNELSTKTKSIPENVSTGEKVASGVGTAMGNIAKVGSVLAPVAGGTAVGMTTAGLAMGSSMIGDDGSASALTRNTGQTLGRAYSPSTYKSSVSNIGRGMNGGNSNDEGGGTSPTPINDPSTGVEFADDNGCILNYDLQKGTFNNEDLNKNTEYLSTINEIKDVFNGTGEYAKGGSKESQRNAAMKHYRNQGIKDVGTDNTNRKLAFSFDRSKMKDTWKPSDLKNIERFVP